jgi:hypothetical protein
MSPSRKTLGLTGPLADGVADNDDDSLLAEQSSIVWGTDFGVVTDIVSGPGGMYVLSLGNEALYRITTRTAPSMVSVSAIPEPSGLLGISLFLLFARRARHHHAPTPR